MNDKSVIAKCCDGSINEENVSCTFTFSEGREYFQYRILPTCNIYTAEAYAIVNDLRSDDGANSAVH